MFENNPKHWLVLKLKLGLVLKQRFASSIFFEWTNQNTRIFISTPIRVSMSTPIRVSDYFRTLRPMADSPKGRLHALIHSLDLSLRRHIPIEAWFRLSKPRIRRSLFHLSENINARWFHGWVIFKDDSIQNCPQVDYWEI